MPPFRFSFWGRFVLVFCGFAAVAFCFYFIEAVLFYEPQPGVPAYDIAPRLTAAQKLKNAQTEKMTEAQKQADAAAAAAKAEQQKRQALAGGLQETSVITPFFAKADWERGRRIFARCAACHTNSKGAGNRIGPDLWGINGRAVATQKNFSYSAAMKSFALKQKHWDLAALDKFLYSPAADVPGTIMSYAGVKDLQERADLLLYLQSLTDAPKTNP